MRYTLQIGRESSHGFLMDKCRPSGNVVIVRLGKFAFVRSWRLLSQGCIWAEAYTRPSVHRNANEKRDYKR
jgi:hypothetical protein